MRVVCLSPEAAEICFRLGAEEDVVVVFRFCSPRTTETSGTYVGPPPNRRGVAFGVAGLEGIGALQLGMHAVCDEMRRPETQDVSTSWIATNPRLGRASQGAAFITSWVSAPILTSSGA